MFYPCTIFFINFLKLFFIGSAFHTCQPTAFTCGNGRCVPYHYRCDHYNDCGDNSDEAGCLFRTCDSHTEFTCNNGRCISLQYVCNGVNNCYDNGTSDERNCRKSFQITKCIFESDSLDQRRGKSLWVWRIMTKAAERTKGFYIYITDAGLCYFEANWSLKDILEYPEIFLNNYCFNLPRPSKYY